MVDQNNIPTILVDTIDLRTTDIVLAAALRSLNYDLSGIEKNGHKGTFIFSKIPTDIIEKYDLGQLLVEPVTLNHNIKQLTTSARRSL